jgi:nitrite reductase/ring-hydroxylating ferredoxin subunit
LHASLNVLALGLFIGSLTARKQRNRGLGRTLALAGFSVAGASAYLGGDLVFRQKIGVNHAPEDPRVPEFQAVMPEAELPQNRLTRAKVFDIQLVLLRRGDQVHALAETCAHMGGPLAEGQLSEDADGRPTVICPWHQSEFDLTDGSVIHGPAAYPQPCFEARIANGMVEVRRRKD